MTRGSPRLNAKRLASLLREKRREGGKSLREAAEDCGVAFSTLSRLERAQGGKPDLDTLERIAGWLDVPLAALFERPQPVEAHLRAPKNLDSRAATALRTLIVAAREQYGGSVSSERDEHAETEAEHEPIPREQWEPLASSIRRDIGAKTNEPIDPFGLKVHGARVAFPHDIRGVPEEVLNYLLGDGMGKWSAATIPLDDRNQDWLIVINSAHSTERKRASLMEEYCHVLLGHEMTQLNHQEGVTFRDYRQDQEQEAFSIGAAILIPAEALHARLAKHEPADKIAKHFGVSRELVEYRIKRLGLWYLYRLQVAPPKEQ